MASSLLITSWKIYWVSFVLTTEKQFTTTTSINTVYRYHVVWICTQLMYATCTDGGSVEFSFKKSSSRTLTWQKIYIKKEPGSFCLRVTSPLYENLLYFICHMLTETQTDKQQSVCRKAMRLCRVTELFSSVQSIFITEETVNKL